MRIRIFMYYIYHETYLCLYVFYVSRINGSRATYDSVGRIDKIICLFCKRALQKRKYYAKETYNCYGVATVSRID